MKHLVFLTIALTLSLSACAQNKGKITIKITDDTGSSTKIIEKTYGTREEMLADEELRDFGFYTFNVFSSKDFSPLHEKEIEEITAMAEVIKKEALATVSEVHIDKTYLKEEMEKLHESLKNMELGELKIHRRVKPD